jgi:hypothetical protein
MTLHCVNPRNHIQRFNSGCACYFAKLIDDDILFLDVIVDGDTFYTSAGFWRMASFPLPNGDINSEFVTVWQDYSIGTHYDDPEMIRASVSRIIERFIAKYSAANNTGNPLRVASAP